MKLTVGTDSTWSLRAWMCSQLAGLDVEVNVIDLTKPGHKAEAYKYSVTGLVPSLDTGSFVVHDSLSIAEYLDEYSGGALYPKASAERAMARSLCAELHSGFKDVRSMCPFTLERVAPVLTAGSGIKGDLVRIQSIFESAQQPYMYSSAGAVDAFYSILAYRLQTYGLELKGEAGEYQKSLLAWPVLLQAIRLAHSWKEPYAR